MIQAKVLSGILEGDAVGVAHQQVGGARRGAGAQNVRVATREQRDQHEVIKVERKGGNQQRRERLDDQRQGDFEQVGERATAVYRRGFV